MSDLRPLRTGTHQTCNIYWADNEPGVASDAGQIGYIRIGGIARRMVDAYNAAHTSIELKVRNWKLYSGAEYGGIYCAEPDCGCVAEGSQIVPGAWGDEPEGEQPTFTLAEMAELLAAHIEQRAAVKAEEAESG
jgi:hypothetical protein